MAFYNLYLCPMRKILVAVVITLYCWAISNAQVSYLKRPDLLDQVDSCLQHTYNFSFNTARLFQRELARTTPDHPAPYFLEAMIIYWENFPLTPRDNVSERFEELMNKSIKLAETFIEIDRIHLEGVFFDLFSRALKAMFWADNGKEGKVIPDLRTMFRHTKEGFQLKEQFSEFYFSTGLYNYYIEAYPEAHPIYKPLVAFMDDGDKMLGLKQLNHSINHTVFLKVESILFMSIIQLKYEKDLNTAVIYAERLFRDYPQNVFYQGHLVTILLHQHRFYRVKEVLEEMKIQDNKYSEMVRAMASAFLAEKEIKNDLLAGKLYMKTVEFADSFGPFADQFKAIGYMGLSRLNEQKGLNSEARTYERKASKHTSYAFILDE